MIDAGTLPDLTLPSHDERLAVARCMAGWELGSRGWADRIVAAYCAPAPTAERLREEMDR